MSPFAPSVGSGGAGGVGGTFIFVLLVVVFFIASLFMPGVIFAVFLFSIPIFVVKIIEMTLFHPAARPVARTVAQKRPDYMIERELLQIMERQDAGEWEIEKLINEVSPLRRWYIRLQYQHRARTAKQLREMADAQRQAVEEETKLGSSVHALERARRRRADRR
jgi:hypothetical protein